MMEPKNSIASSRDRRNNAGSRMMKLIEEEDEDDFYKTTYGGFTEEADDNDYVSEDTASEATDTDFDVDEDDQLKSDVEDDKEAKKKSNKAYKEPKKNPGTNLTEKPAKIKQANTEKMFVDANISASEKKSLRKSTFEKSTKMEDVVKEREAKSAILKQIADKKKVSEVRRLTQEELLAEARITEEINLASLEYYQQMELERKRVRIEHQNSSGPTIRYTSMAISQTPIQQEELNTKDDIKNCAKYSQNFISFSDEQTFKENFPYRRPPQPAVKHLCPITHLPAKYFDPLTKQPYATLEAFKILRQEHKRQLELDNSDIEGRKKNKNLYYFN